MLANGSVVAEIYDAGNIDYNDLSDPVGGAFPATLYYKGTAATAGQTLSFRVEQTRGSDTSMDVGIDNWELTNMDLASPIASQYDTLSIGQVPFGYEWSLETNVGYTSARASNPDLSLPASGVYPGDAAGDGGIQVVGNDGGPPLSIVEYRFDGVIQDGKQYDFTSYLWASSISYALTDVELVADPGGPGETVLATVDPGVVGTSGNTVSVKYISDASTAGQQLAFRISSKRTAGGSSSRVGIDGWSLEVGDPQSVMLIHSLGSGSEGDTTYSDSTPFGIDATGNFFTYDEGSEFQDFSVVEGTVYEAAAFGADMDFTLQGMSNVDTATGAKLADGGIDRSSSGMLGVRGSDTNGIDSLEGFLLGIDATDLDPSLTFQITEVWVEFVGGVETGKIVNRNDISKSMTFGAVGTGSDWEGSTGAIDVSELDLTVRGGIFDDEIASIFSDTVGEGNFRITDFGLTIVDSVLLPGDFDGDGDVDVADLMVWQRTDGTASSLAEWKSAFTGGGSLGGLAAVPEPGALVLLLSGLVTAPLVRRRYW